MKLSSLGKEVHHSFKHLNSDYLQIPSSQRYELKMANRLYGQKGFKFIPEYLASTRDVYGTQLEAVDFEKETDASREAIND